MTPSEKAREMAEKAAERIVDCCEHSGLADDGVNGACPVCIASAIIEAVEREREACAMVAEAVADEWNEKLDAAPQETILSEREAVGRVAGRILGARRIAIAIRSRGKTEPPVEETT